MSVQCIEQEKLCVDSYQDLEGEYFGMLKDIGGDKIRTELEGQWRMDGRRKIGLRIEN